MRNNLFVAAVLGLSVAGLAACSGGEDKQPVEDVSSVAASASTMRADQPTTPPASQQAESPQMQAAPEAPQASPPPTVDNGMQGNVAPAPEAQPALPDGQETMQQPASPESVAPENGSQPAAPQDAMPPASQQMQPQEGLPPDVAQQPPAPQTQTDDANPEGDGMNSATFNPNKANTTPGTAAI